MHPTVAGRAELPTTCAQENSTQEQTRTAEIVVLILVLLSKLKGRQGPSLIVSLTVINWVNAPISNRWSQGFRNDLQPYSFPPTSGLGVVPKPEPKSANLSSLQ